MTSRGSSGRGASGPGVEADQPPPFWLIVSITLTGIMGNTLITPVIPTIRDDLGVGTSAAALMLAAGTAPGIVLAPVIGLLADRYGRREVVVPCLLVFGVAGGLTAFAPTFEVVLILRFVQGIGASGLVNLAVTIIGDHWEGVERTRRIGWNAACLTASIFVLPVVGGVLAAVAGWRATFVPYWLGVGTAVLIATRLPRRRRHDVTLRAQLRATTPFLRSPAVVAPVLAGFGVFMLIFGVVLTAIPVHLADEFDIGPGGRGMALALPAVASTTLALVVGRFRARRGSTTVVRLGLLLFVAGFSLMAAVPALLAMGVSLLLYGAGEGLLIPTLQDTVASAAPEASRGAVVALFVGFARAGQTAGPLLAGLGLETLGARGTFAAGAVLAGAMILVQGNLRKASKIDRGASAVLAPVPEASLPFQQP